MRSHWFLPERAYLGCCRLRTPSTRPTKRARAASGTKRARAASGTAERARDRTPGLAITHHFLTPPTCAQHQRCASPLTRPLAHTVLAIVRARVPPSQAPKCITMTATCDMSVLGSITDHLVTIPILLPQRRSVGCFTYPSGAFARAALEAVPLAGSSASAGVRHAQMSRHASAERERLKALERENRELRRANAILRKASA